MKTHRYALWVFFALTVWLLGFNLAQAQGRIGDKSRVRPHPYLRTEDFGSGSSAATIGIRSVASTESSTSSGPSVLLLADANTTGTTALYNALTGAGYIVTLRPPPEYTWDGTNPPLSGFDCVIHLDGATVDSPLPVSGQTALVDFVRSGGGFIASQWDGYESTTGTQTAMDDLVLQGWGGGVEEGGRNADNCESCTITYSVVLGQESHPVLAGIPASFSFSADGHDAGDQVTYLVYPSTVLMRVLAGGPAVLVREFELGRVVNFSHAANSGNAPGLTLQDPNIQRLYINAVRWTFQKGNQSPLANAGPDQTLECSSHSGQLTTLDGSGSTDPDHDPLTYTWRESGNIIAGPTSSSTSQVTLVLGSHTIELTVEDGKGGSSKDVVVINVMDTTPPTVTLIGANPVVLECPAAYTEPGATVSDACDPSPSLTMSGAVNAHTPGEYTITYTSTDASGNSAHTTRTVRVVDTTPPTITLKGANPVVLECPTTYSEPGATARDACDPNPSLVVSGSVDSHTPGEYTITYTATDASGNSSTISRTVRMRDTTPPVITLKAGPKKLWPPNHIYSSLSVSDVIQSISDACAGQLPGASAIITSVTSDEEEDVETSDNAKKGGDGITLNDIVISGDCKSVNLRAERVGNGNGRVYTIQVAVADPSGNVAVASYEVHVPHDMRPGAVAVNDGPAYMVSGSCAGALAASAEAARFQKIQNSPISSSSQGSAVSRIPTEFALDQNYPNPFNPSTLIRYGLPNRSRVKLEIYDLLGQKVAALVDGEQEAQLHEVTWQSQVASGMYFYRLEAVASDDPNKRFVQVRKMILLR